MFGLEEWYKEDEEHERKSGFQTTREFEDCFKIAISKRSRCDRKRGKGVKRKIVFK